MCLKVRLLKGSQHGSGFYLLVQSVCTLMVLKQSWMESKSDYTDEKTQDITSMCTFSAIHTADGVCLYNILITGLKPKCDLFLGNLQCKIKQHTY